MTNPRNELFNNYVYCANLNLLRIKRSFEFDNVWVIGLSFYTGCIINLLVQKFVIALLGLHFRFPLQMLPERGQGDI